VEATDPSGLVFQLDWGTKQFNAFLRRLFPLLFAHFDSILPGFGDILDEPDSAGLKRIEFSLPYVLLAKQYRKYNIVDDTHPAAIKYKECLSGDGNNSGFRNKGIFIGAFPSCDHHTECNTNSTFSDQGTNCARSTQWVVLTSPSSCNSHSQLTLSSTNCNREQESSC
jgi:hypothetical protein